MGEEPSRLLHEKLRSRTLNVLFTDKQFVQQFQKALDRDPLTEAALRGIKPFVIPSNRASRRTAAEKLPVDTNLSSSVQDLCDRLKENPSCLTVREDLQTRQDAVKVDDALSVHGLHKDVEDKAQLYDVMDSLLCILMSWYTSRSGPEEVAQQIFDSKYARIQDKVEAEEEKGSIIANCRRRSLSGSKIYTFCSDFIQDPGAVFHLPREIKAMIVAIGLPNKSFRDIHDILSRRLIENEIKIHAKENGGAEILRRMKSIVDEATLRWHTPVVAGGAPTITSAVAPAAIPSQQREAMTDNESPEVVTPVYQTTAFGASGLARDEHISWNSSLGGGGDSSVDKTTQPERPNGLPSRVDEEAPRSKIRLPTEAVESSNIHSREAEAGEQMAGTSCTSSNGTTINSHDSEPGEGSRKRRRLDGACTDNVAVGEDVDLGILPDSLIPGDGAPDPSTDFNGWLDYLETTNITDMPLDNDNFWRQESEHDIQGLNIDDWLDLGDGFPTPHW
ncbi:hypothetical protein LTS17_012590 [Exophiala oligosperma]